MWQEEKVNYVSYFSGIVATMNSGQVWVLNFCWSKNSNTAWHTHYSLQYTSLTIFNHYNHNGKCWTEELLLLELLFPYRIAIERSICIPLSLLQCAIETAIAVILSAPLANECVGVHTLPSVSLFGGWWCWLTHYCLLVVLLQMMWLQRLAQR